MAETKLDRLFADILRKTRDRSIIWTVTPTGFFEPFVMHSGFIFRSFQADYEQGHTTYQLGFVVKKVPHSDADDERVETSVPELLIFRGERLILTITQYHVEVESLRELAALIGEGNDDASKLLDNF